MKKLIPTKPKKDLVLVPPDAEVLHTKAKQWHEGAMSRKKLKQLINDMLWYIDGKGIGLAAPQVGIALNVIVINCGERMAFVNPTITQAQGRVYREETCLSFPGKKVEIARASLVSLMYENAFTGKLERRALIGLEARCVQHEIDHLKGIVIGDYEDAATVETGEICSASDGDS